MWDVLFQLILVEMIRRKIFTFLRQDVKTQ